jgi:hypothetical protein
MVITEVITSCKAITNPDITNMVITDSNTTGTVTFATVTADDTLISEIGITDGHRPTDGSRIQTQPERAANVM